MAEQVPLRWDPLAWEDYGDGFSCFQRGQGIRPIAQVHRHKAGIWVPVVWEPEPLQLPIQPSEEAAHKVVEDHLIESGFYEPPSV